ncbi:MAG: ATP-binding protein [Pseudomonadota bacterium]
MHAPTLPIAKAFAGFLLGTGLLALALASTGVWYASRTAFEARQDTTLRDQAQAIADAYALIIDASNRALAYLARQPLITQAVMGEELDLANASDMVRSYDIEPAILRISIYDILREPIIDETIGPNATTTFASVVRREMADHLFRSDDGPRFRHPPDTDGEHLLIALPIRVHGMTEGAMVAELRMPELASLADQADIASIAFLHEAHDVMPVMSATDLIMRPIGRTGLWLLLRPDRSVLEAVREALVLQVLAALSAALMVVFTASHFIGRRLIVKPQRMMEDSRRRLIESEARARELASIVQQTNDAIVLTDLDGRIVWCNAAVEQITGYSRNEMMGRKPGDMLQGPETDRDTVRQIRKALRRREPHRTEILNYRKDGQPYWLDINILPLFDETGQAQRFVAIERDVSEAKERETQLSASQAAAEAATRAKSNFLASMSHEIRTPMNGIIGMADLLTETPLDAEQRVCADTIRDSANSLLTIINDILDFSKVEAGKLELQLEPMNLSRHIDDVAQLLAPVAAEKGLEIIVDDNINTDVKGLRLFQSDTARVRQILVNIVGNAVKFTETGRVVISTRAEPRAPGERVELTIDVQDTGIGIPEDKLQTVFRAFEQADNSVARRYEGTGLGLAITKRLVETLGGEISVSSELGKGSCFSLTLRLMEEAALEPTGIKPVMLVNKSILLLYHDAVLAEVLERQILDAGMKVTSIPNDAFGAGYDLGDLRFDAVLIDEPRGALKPETALDAVLSSNRLRGVPALLLTSVNRSFDKDRLLGLGFAGVLLKPLRARTLHSQLSSLLTGIRQTTVQDAAAASADIPDLSGVRILIAEDNQTNQLVIGRMLKQTGADYHFVDDGEAAVTAFFELRPEIVLMDCSMPILSGYDAARQIRARQCRETGSNEAWMVPIIAITANVMKEDRARCFEAGMTDFIGKPLRKKDLFRALAEARSRDAERATDRQPSAQT